MRVKFYIQKDIFETLDSKDKVDTNTLDDIHLVIIMKKEYKITIKLQKNNNIIKTKQGSKYYIN